MRRNADQQEKIITSQQMDGAFKWLCQQRKRYPANSDVWHFRANWLKERPELLKLINSGDYCFSPMQRITNANGKAIHLWCSCDAITLKCLAMAIQGQLTLSKQCTHVKGHGGLKQTVKTIQQQLPQYQFVCKTDVKGYYESIDQYLLYELIAKQISANRLKRYLYQVIHRTVESGGNYRDISTGISRGCPLSPLLGALYLKQLDDHFKHKDVYYVRYMDDILILSKTRWHNRKAIKAMNQIFNQLKLKQHPDKTFMGRIERGFDFLGYHFSTEPLQLAKITVRKYVERYSRLYEQLKRKKANSNESALVLEQYVKRWQCWCTAGLGITSLIYDGKDLSRRYLSP
jgi:RNA-directed DNA polymerase